MDASRFESGVTALLKNQVHFVEIEAGCVKNAAAEANAVAGYQFTTANLEATVEVAALTLCLTTSIFMGGKIRVWGAGPCTALLQYKSASINVILRVVPSGSERWPQHHTEHRGDEHQGVRLSQNT